MSRSSVPKYRSASNGQAFVQHRSIPTSDHRMYLGKFNSPKSIEKYQQFLKRLAAGDEPTPTRPLTSSPTVDCLIDVYYTHAESYYRRPDGLSPEFDAMAYALKPLHELFGESLACDFGPRSLVVIRKHLAQSGLARTNINRQIPRIKRKKVMPVIFHLTQKLLTPNPWVKKLS